MKLIIPMPSPHAPLCPARMDDQGCNCGLGDSDAASDLLPDFDDEPTNPTIASPELSVMERATSLVAALERQERLSSDYRDTRLLCLSRELLAMIETREGDK